MLTRSFILGRPGLKMSRWRPVCPECGYSLRGSTGDRCPECGQPFPTSERFFRRWACRRLPWDRFDRRGRVRALVASVLWIIVTPTRAACGLSIPDRWGRAATWCAAWILVGSVAAATLGTHRNAIASVVWPDSGLLAYPDFWQVMWGPPRWRALWIAQSAATHAAHMALVVAIGIAVSLLQPWRHAAARRAGVKWSLYASAVMPLAVVAFVGAQAIAVVRAGSPAAAAALSQLRTASPMPLEIVVVAYLIWWSIGMAAGMFARSRSVPDAFGYAVALGVAYMLVRVLFPLGELEQLA